MIITIWLEFVADIHCNARSDWHYSPVMPTNRSQDCKTKAKSCIINNLQFINLEHSVRNLV